MNGQIDCHTVMDNREAAAEKQKKHQKKHAKRKKQ